MKPGSGKISPPARRSLWQRLRIYFRRFRAAVWTLVILAILATLWLNQVGLPGFLKRPLLEKLRARGIELQFTNLRLSWSRGFVAYNVRFGRAADPAAPQFSARRVEVPLNSVALRHFDFEIGGLVLCDALLRWPINETDQPLRELTATNLNATVHFRPGDAWQLDNFSARVGGVKVLLNGELTHASAIRHWRSAAATQTNLPPAAAGRAQLRQVAATLDSLKFTEPPGLRVSVFGDARDGQSFKIAASLAAAATTTPWGEFAGTRLTVRSAGFGRLAAPATGAAAPELTFVHLQTRFDGGDLDLAANLNLATRTLRFGGVSDFDLQKIRPLLNAGAARWLGQFSWERPPHLALTGAAVWPVWTNRTDWPGAFAAALELDGEFRLGRGAFRGVPALAAQSHFSYSNFVWRLPDLQLTRPEGRLHVEHWTDNRTLDYFWRLRGALDPAAVRPLLEPDGQRGLDLVRCPTAPVWDAEIRGRWRAPELTSARAQVAASNFTFRGESIATLTLTAEYTNLFLRILQPEITRGGNERATLDGVGVDFTAKRAYLTNGVCTLDPMVVGRAIGPKTAQAFEPYQFLTPPLAHVAGAVSLVTNRYADLHVEIEGGPFRWWKFNVPHIRGELAWGDRTLLLTNVTAQFCGGTAAGMADFDFAPAGGNDFHFDLTFRDANLRTLMADLTRNTNRLEGTVSGRLAVRQANTEDWKSWQGEGAIRLRDGLLWEIPVFGVFTPVLNTFWPNLGSGRASDGAATFTITNGVVRSDDLELRSPMMRMQYRGTVDFAGNLAARVEAEPLRDTWAIGPVVSTVLRPISKALEFKVTGNLDQPKAAPVYLPKFFLIPFTPFQSLRELFTEKPAAPPAVTPLP